MPKQKKQQSHRPSPMEKAMALTEFCAAETDPMGSYTGRPAQPGEVPVQDADDL